MSNLSSAGHNALGKTKNHSAKELKNIRQKNSTCLPRVNAVALGKL